MSDARETPTAPDDGDPERVFLAWGCTRCGRDLHAECRFLSGGSECCGRTSTCPQNEFKSGTLPSIPSPAGDSANADETEDRFLKDPHSTARKAAVLVLPMEPMAPCEWQRLANCGGGQYPIVGCLAGEQETVHHGPEKIPGNLRQSELARLNYRNPNPSDPYGNNIHRICKRCHALWHAWNDAVYIPGGPFEPHNPRPGDPEELMMWHGAATRPKPPVPRAGSLALRTTVIEEDLDDLSEV